MSKSEQCPKSFEDMNNEFQYLWNKYDRDDWDSKNLGDYCSNLECMIMNYLDRNNELKPIKSTASKNNKKLDIRPNVVYKNYDYIDQDKSEKEHTKSGPGGGLYDGKMDKYKSVKDFVDTDRKLHQKQRKDALNDLLKGRTMASSMKVKIDKENSNSLNIMASELYNLLNIFASGIIGDVEIPKEVLEKIKEENDKKNNNVKEENIIEENIDSGINGIPYFNSRDPASGLEGLNQTSPGTPWDNDIMRNSYQGILSLQGKSVNETLKIAEIYYKLSMRR